jgi:hypothetical protein
MRSDEVYYLKPKVKDILFAPEEPQGVATSADVKPRCPHTRGDVSRSFVFWYSTLK